MNAIETEDTKSNKKKKEFITSVEKLQTNKIKMELPHLFVRK